MINDKFVSKGAASFTLDDDREKQVFYFLLLPKLTMLAFSSALEPLRIVNQLTQKEIYNWHINTAHARYLLKRGGYKPRHRIRARSKKCYNFCVFWCGAYVYRINK